eukprot:10134742-Alexandrium_andersonii.AAC.1
MPELGQRRRIHSTDRLRPACPHSVRVTSVLCCRKTKLNAGIPISCVLLQRTGPIGPGHIARPFERSRS